MRRRNRQGAGWAWVAITLLILSMAVAGTMECNDAAKVESFSQEWKPYYDELGNFHRARIGYAAGDPLRVVQGKKCLSEKH